VGVDYPDNPKMKKANTLKRQIMLYVNAVFKIIIWVFGIILIYWLLLKITGHSPTSETVFMSAFGVLVTLHLFTLGLVIRNSVDISDIKRFMKEADRRFYAFAADYRKHVERMH